MEKNCFLYFGNEEFENFKNVTVDNERFNVNNKFHGKVFNSLILNDKHHEITRVFLGWSYSLFQIDKKFYHEGFWSTSCNNNVPKTVFTSPELNEIADISCGLDTLIFATGNGACYFCPVGQTINDLTPVRLNGESMKIKCVTSCDIYNVMLNYDGQVFLMQFSNKGSVLPLLLPCKIIQVVCGKEHILMLSETGQIFSYGCGSRGQLGHGDIINQEKPLLLEALDGIQIVSIDAGGWHSAAISSSGDLYMWGWNESGQLGKPCKEHRMDSMPLEEIETICCLPKHVPFKDDIKVLSVSCGSRHSAALTEDGCLWTWGWNGYGQLGHNNCKLSDKPETVTLPDGFVPNKLCCKFWGTLISGKFVKDILFSPEDPES